MHKSKYSVNVSLSNLTADDLFYIMSIYYYLFILSHTINSAALISVFLVPSQTPTYSARSRTRG